MNKLTTEEVCHILKECATSKVSLLSFGDLYIEFGASKEVTKSNLPDLSQGDHDKLNAAQVQRDAEDLRAIEIDELLLTDPERYEEMLSKGEI